MMFEADVACAGRHAEGRAQSDRRGGHRHHQQNRQRRRKHRLPGGRTDCRLGGECSVRLSAQ